MTLADGESPVDAESTVERFGNGDDIHGWLSQAQIAFRAPTCWKTATQRLTADGPPSTRPLNGNSDMIHGSQRIISLVDYLLKVWDGGVGHTKVGTLPNGLGLITARPYHGYQGSLNFLLP